ncbi:MAG: hypothetical protein CW338_02705 [Clostridiales bacterium]|nr:hypothetical protein [Clostridiales bacterium]
MVELGNIYYFMFLLAGAGIFCLVYFLLRGRDDRTKKTVFFIWLMLNFSLHFLKQLIPGYSLPDSLHKSTAENICAVSTLFFPFIMLLKKENPLRDFMFFIGVAGGMGAFLYPTEAFGRALNEPDIYRFYFCHFTLGAVPLLSELLGLYRPRMRRFWVIPLLFLCCEAVIFLNEAVLASTGIVSSTPAQFFDRDIRNNGFVFGPTSDMAGLGNILTAVVPSFMKRDITGLFGGGEMYWPVVWLLIPGFVYFTPLWLIMCLPAHLRDKIRAGRKEKV